jgi:hypothetical protein
MVGVQRSSSGRVKVLFSLTLLIFVQGCQSTSSLSLDWESKVRLHHEMTPGGQLLLEAMEAHGGLEQWYANGILSFRWTYFMRDLGPEAMVDTHQKVDLSSMEVVHKVPDTDIRFGWTEGGAWIDPPEASSVIPARFWALTPIYFVGMPFVFADVGTQAKLLDDFEFEGVVWRQIKITFSSELVDAPDDIYILLVHPQKKYIGGVRYTLTSPQLTERTAAKEKLLTLDHQEWVKGIYLPKYHRTFSMKEGRPHQKVRDAKVRDLKFLHRGSIDFQSPVGALKL